MFVFSFGFIAAIGLYNTVNYGLASLSYYSVQNTVQVWQNNRKSQTESNYIKAKSAITNARKRHKAHPLYTELAAQIYEWGAIGGYENKSIGLEVSKRYYMAAIKMRPTWPVTYASLAMNKWRSNEFDGELVEYLKLANQYGPKKAETNILFSELGLALYQNNHPFYAELRPYLRPRISQGLRNVQSRERVLEAIEYYKAKRTVCRWMKKDDPFMTREILNCEHPV
ncbi:MAG: hypothetical protein ACI97K_002322 [Glaciecola sp.]|jgi:hypothetical protein